MGIAARLLFFIALPQVEMGGSVSCAGKDEVVQALKRVLPDELPALRVSLQTEHAADDRGYFEAHLEVRGTDEQRIIDRRLRVASGDCAELPRLVAHIIARAVRKLPGQRWPDKETNESRPARTTGQPLPKNTTRKRPGPPHPRRIPWTLDVSGGLGLSVGAAPGMALFESTAQAAAGRGRLRLLALAAFTHGQTPEFASGQAVLSDVSGGVGVSYQVPLGRFSLAPELVILAGARFARGSGFVHNRSDLLPLVAVRTGVTARTPWGPFLGVGAHVPVVRARIGVGGAAEDFTEPRVRALFLLGYGRQLSFF
jgi:hypothetical protein